MRGYVEYMLLKGEKMSWRGCDCSTFPSPNGSHSSFSRTSSRVERENMMTAKAFQVPIIVRFVRGASSKGRVAGRFLVQLYIRDDVHFGGPGSVTWYLIFHCFCATSTFFQIQIIIYKYYIMCVTMRDRGSTVYACRYQGPLVSSNGQWM
jgi:hypothetical protein